MAIGDAISALMGAAAVNRQPAAGVEEKITAILSGAATDPMSLFDATTAVRILIGSATGVTDVNKNYAVMITNSVFLRKEGATDIMGISGVQTNA